MCNAKLKYITAYILLNLLCLTQFLSITGLSAGLAAAVILFSILFPYSEYGVYLFLTLPFFNILNFRIGSVSMYYLLIIIALFLYVWRGHDRHIALKGFVLLAFLLVTITNMAEPREYLSWILRILPFIFLADQPMITYKLRQIIHSYSVSMLFASAWGWLMLKTGVSIYNQGYVWISTGNATTRFAGLVGDAVIYGNQTVLLISLLALLYFHDNRYKKAYIACIAALAVFGSMTYSKSFFFCLLIEAVLIYGYWLRCRTKNRRFLVMNLLVLLGALAGLFVFVHLLNTSDHTFFLSLRTRLSSNDLLTGRWRIWGNYISWFIRHPSILFKGMHIGEYKSLGWAHNLFLETFALFGAAASVLIFALFFICTVRLYQSQKNGMMILPILMLLVIGLTVHGHMESAFYMNLLLVFSCAKWLGRTSIDGKDTIHKL